MLDRFARAPQAERLARLNMPQIVPIELEMNAPAPAGEAPLDAVIFIASAIIGTILLLVPEPTGITKAIGLGLLAVSVLALAGLDWLGPPLSAFIAARQTVVPRR